MPDFVAGVLLSGLPLYGGRPWEKSKQQKNKVRFMVVREFSGEKSMREAFEQLIERQTCEHFEEWRHQREMAEKAA